MKLLSAVRKGAAKAIFCAILCLCGQSAIACEKKGVALARMDFSPDTVLTKLDAHWYYNWGPVPVKRDGGVPFVAMISGVSSRLQNDLGIVGNQPSVPILLGFNEPDHPNGSNMTVDQAIALWPQLEKISTRLASPAPTSEDLNWLQRFMAEARERNLKVDIIALHYYGPPDPQRFLHMIDEAYEDFHLPIWVTEFAVISKFQQGRIYSPEQVLDFMRVVLPELERRPYVERFAWWGIGRANAAELKSSMFFNDDGSLTDVGKYYASVEANDNEPLCGLP